MVDTVVGRATAWTQAQRGGWRALGAFGALWGALKRFGALWGGTTVHILVDPKMLVAILIAPLNNPCSIPHVTVINHNSCSRHQSCNKLID
jgi:hypothetical protein